MDYNDKIKSPSELCGKDSLCNLRTVLDAKAMRYARTVVYLADLMGKEGSKALVMDCDDGEVAVKPHADGDPARNVLRYYLEVMAETYFDAGWVQAQLEKGD